MVTTSLSEGLETSIRYKVGPYIVIPKERIISRDGIELTIEPKVFDVLVYFCQNRERYILMQELHDNVWQGRLVSDAAVRRAISKLRVILGDNWKSPNFIKSGNKRGYKFSCEVLTNNDEYDKKQEDAKPLINDSAKDTSQKFSFHHSKPLMISAFSLLVTTLVVIKLLPTVDDEQWVSTNALFEYPGEKRVIAAPTNGDNIVFTARLPGFKGFQIFSKNEHTNEIEQITSSPHSVFKLEFSADEESLYFIDLSIGASSINQINLNEGDSSITTIIDEFYLLSDIAVPSNGTGIYFNGLKTIQDPSQLYFYSFAKQEYSPMTHEHNDEFHDNKVAVSDSGLSLAYVTAMGETREQRITVKNLSNKRTTNRFYHDQTIYDIEWVGEKFLIILDNEGMHKINISTQAKEPLHDNLGLSIKSIDVHSNSEIFVLNDRPHEVFFTEVDLTKPDIQEKHVVSVDDSILQILYTGSENTKLVVKKQDNTTLVSTLNNEEESIHLKTSASLDVYQVAKSGHLILAKMDNMLALLNTKTNDVSYIADGKEFLAEDAVFSHDFKKVLYGDKTRNGWVIVEYDIEDKTNQIIFEGYKSIRSSETGYVMANKIDEVYAYDNKEKTITSLDIKISLDLNTRWFVRGDNIYWTNFDTRDTTFHVFNYKTGKNNVYKLSAVQTDPKFDIDPLGENMMIKTRQQINTEILKIEF
jgi:DNA-binding winged helix-turn-helix (wHTH) protein